MKPALYKTINTPVSGSEIMWTPIREGRNRYAHLHGSLMIGGTWLHAHALQVDKSSRAVSPLGGALLERLRAMDLRTNFRTTEIGGRSYVVFLTPWGE
jgi:hypothetical protein